MSEEKEKNNESSLKLELKKLKLTNDNYGIKNQTEDIFLKLIDGNKKMDMVIQKYPNGFDVGIEEEVHNELYKLKDSFYGNKLKDSPDDERGKLNELIKKYDKYIACLDKEVKECFVKVENARKDLSTVNENIHFSDIYEFLQLSNGIYRLYICKKKLEYLKSVSKQKKDSENISKLIIGNEVTIKHIKILFYFLSKKGWIEKTTDSVLAQVFLQSNKKESAVSSFNNISIKSIEESDKIKDITFPSPKDFDKIVTELPL